MWCDTVEGGAVHRIVDHGDGHDTLPLFCSATLVIESVGDTGVAVLFGKTQKNATRAIK